MAQNDPFSPYPDPFSINPELSSEPTQKKSEETQHEEVSSKDQKDVLGAETQAQPIEEFYVLPVRQGDYDEEEEAKKVVMGLVVGIIVILVLGGVGVWYFLSRDTGPKQDVVTPGSFPLTKPQEPRDPNLIVAAIGGKIVTDDGFEVIVPAGALRKDTVITIERISYGDVTDLFQVLPSGTKFLKPVTLRVPYKESGLTEEETPWDIQLKYWLKVASNKRNLQFSVDRSEKKLSTEVREI